MKIRITPVIILLYVWSAFSQQVSLSGTVTRADGSPIAGLTVVLENGGNPEAEDITDAAGNYAMSINAGNYDQLRVRNMGSDITGLPSTIEHTAETSLSITANRTIDITMPAYINLSGYVLYSNGDTVKGANIVAKKWDGVSEAPPWDNDVSGSDGSYSLYQEPGGIKIWITPVGGDEITFAYNIGSDTVMNIIISKPLTLSGTVTTYAGSPITNLTIAFETGTEQYQAISNASGQYSKSLNPGTYRIRLRNGSGPGTVADGVPHTIEVTIIESIYLSSDTVINLSTPFYPALRFSLITSTGTPVANTALTSKKWNGAESPPWDYDTSDASGVGVLLVGSGNNKVWVIPPVGSNLAEMSFEITVTADTTVVITLSEGYLLSGRVYRADNTPVAGINIALEKDADQWMTTTDAVGAYSISMQPNIYRLRVRNLGNVISGIPSTLEHTVAEALNLTQSLVMDIHLPFFPTVSGVAKNAAGNPVSNVVITAKRWVGAEAPPWAEYTTGADGAYTLTVGAGTNKIWVTPPAGSGLGSFHFIENFEANTTKNIYIPDQAKGITKIQPSVISRGKSGTVMIAGISSNFTGGNITINLGSGITVSNIQVISVITLQADIAIAEAAQTGSRDVLVNNGTETLVGPSLLTITAPASAEVPLNSQGKTTGEIVISDGTGTELIIPQGTEVAFPTGAAHIISFEAPILEGEDPELVTGEFTDIQRVLRPSGIKFKDTVKMICQYKDQDVEGVDETALIPYFYIDDSSTGIVGDEITVIDRDTVTNTVTFAILHFSMFRIAKGQIISPIVFNPVTSVLPYTTRFLSITNAMRAYTNIIFYVSPAHRKEKISLQVFDCKGKMVRSLINGIPGQGIHRIQWDNRSYSGTLLGNGVYLLHLRVGNRKTLSKEIILLR